MVNPILLIAIPLAAAFLFTITDKIGRRFSLLLLFGVLVFMLFVSGNRLYELFFLGVPSGEIFTAGFQPPFSISLKMDALEAFLIFCINLVALGAAAVRIQGLRGAHLSALVLFMAMMIGATGIIMTRDLFNLFVFMEISSIASAGSAVFRQNRRSLEAGFKYLVAGAIASAFFLIGTIYLYRLSGTLYLPQIAAIRPFLSAPGFAAIFLVMAAVVIELKPYPANGWALDYYQAVDPAIVSVVATVNSAAMLAALWKIMPLAGPGLTTVVLFAGVGTFFFSNLAGLRQKDKKRLLGYSSTAQNGLLVAVVAMTALEMFSPLLVLLIPGGFFLNHLFAKAALFWEVAGAENRFKRSQKGRGLSLTIFATLILALTGLPPFPGFWAKWALVTRLLSGEAVMAGAGIVVLLLLAGSLFEAGYLLRWLGSLISMEQTHTGTSAAAALAALLLGLLGVTAGLISGVNPMILYWIAGGAIVLGLSALLPSVIAGITALAVIAAFGWWSYPLTAGLARFFWIIFIPGGALVLFSGFSASVNSRRFWPSAGITIIALGALTIAKSPLEYFFAWEIMTLSSFLLAGNGKDRLKAQNASLRYMLFSLGGAFAMLAGFALSGAGGLNSISGLEPAGPFALMLILTGFLVKMGSAPVHIWLPDTYTEAEEGASALFSAIISKAGAFGLFAAGTLMVGQSTTLFSALDLPLLLRWIGAATALFGALLAVFQEDVKRLLAYSSMSQLGYVLLAFGVMSSLGWTAGLYITFIHVIFKMMLFLAVAGVVIRTGTRNMYQMGGLIKKMPLTFLSSLMAIIAVSGVPPLAGFGSKWLLYTALMEKGYYLLAAIAFFSSTIAFLYLFRFIHSLFLGQLKVEHRKVKEAPLAVILPQLLLFIPLMVISLFPSILVNSSSAIAGAYFPINFSWKGLTMVSSMGYWNATAIMIVTAVVFLLLLLWLIIIQRKPQRAGQFNIVFAAERPYRPETSHVAHNFFQPYQRALGFMVRPGAVRFWNGATEAIASLGGVARRIYTGNSRTYALTIVLYTGLLYLITWRVF